MGTSSWIHRFVISTSSRSHSEADHDPARARLMAQSSTWFRGRISVSTDNRDAKAGIYAMRKGRNWEAPRVARRCESDDDAAAWRCKCMVRTNSPIPLERRSHHLREPRHPIAQRKELEQVTWRTLSVPTL